LRHLRLRQEPPHSSRVFELVLFFSNLTFPNGLRQRVPGRLQNFGLVFLKKNPSQPVNKIYGRV
jgi:hypothetical protein